MEDKNTSKPDEKFWKDLWNKYSTRSFDRDKANMLLDEWKIYKEKIEKGVLMLDEYTNLISATDKQKIKSGISSYLTNFLERETKFFGYSKGGNAKHYMIKKHNPTNKKNEQSLKEGEYYVKSIENPLEEKNVNQEDAKIYFTKQIIPLLKKIISCKSFKDLKNLEENDLYKNYTAKQVLRKMVVLNSLIDSTDNGLNYKFLFIYDAESKDNVIDKLYKRLDLDDSENKNYYEKNNFILEKIKDILFPKEDLNKEKIYRIYAMLWDYATYTNDDFPTEEEPNVIFYGAPGTGKTYAVNQFLKMKNITPDHYKVVQFHPSFTYEDFIEGIKTTGIDNGNVKLELVNGIFKQFCIEAKKDPNNEYYFIADEINRANLSSVFGETLSLLEADYRDDCSDENNRHLIDTQYSQLEIKLNDKEIFYDEKQPGKFGIPKNIRFIGMMNDVDKSIDSFDLALRRRFKWIRKDCDYALLKDVLKDSEEFGKVDSLYIEDYCECCKKLNNYISLTLNLGKSYEFGHSFFLNIKKSGFISTSGQYAYQITTDSKEKVFDKYLKPTLQEYLRGICESDKDVEDKIKTARETFTGSKKTEKSETDNS